MLITWQELALGIQNFHWVLDNHFENDPRLSGFWKTVGLNPNDLIRKTPTHLDGSIEVPDEIGRRVQLMTSPHLPTILKIYLLTKELE